MPPSASSIDWEKTLVLPLGALANQLVKIEGDLRFLSMKATEHAEDDQPRSLKAVDVRLELIFDALDSIKTLLVKMQNEFHPKAAAKDSEERQDTAIRTRKPPPELDD